MKLQCRGSEQLLKQTQARPQKQQKRTTHLESWRAHLSVNLIALEPVCPAPRHHQTAAGALPRHGGGRRRQQQRQRGTESLSGCAAAFSSCHGIADAVGMLRKWLFSSSSRRRCRRHTAVRGTSLADHLRKDASGTIGAVVLPWKFTIQVRAARAGLVQAYRCSRPLPWAGAQLLGLDQPS